MPWSLDKKAEIRNAIGMKEYTSSDQSDFSEDEEGNCRLSAYLVKKLPWERSALTNVTTYGKTYTNNFPRNGFSHGSLTGRSRLEKLSERVALHDQTGSQKSHTSG